jgi:hypothetical protein
MLSNMKKILKFISNVEQSTTEFYTSNSEENINIVSSQHRVFKNKSCTLSSHRQYRKKSMCNRKIMSYIREKTSPLKHNTGIWKYSAFVFIHKVIYRFEMFL